MTSRRGVWAVGIILFALLGAALLTLLLGTSIVFPRTMLDGLWDMNPSARSAFGGSAILASAVLFTLCTTCAAAAFGLLRARSWGWYLSVALFAVVFLFNLLRLLSGDRGEYFGTPFTGGLLLMHFFPGVRSGRSRAAGQQ